MPHEEAYQGSQQQARMSSWRSAARGVARGSTGTDIMEIGEAPVGSRGQVRMSAPSIQDRAPRGRDVQVDLSNPRWKPPGTMHLKLICDGLVSSFAFNFSFRHYSVGPTPRCEALSAECRR
jgi:hypothetical protein